MPRHLSAVDCVSPSFERTKRQLFVPFRFERWGRLAIVCLVLGDFAGGGGYTRNINIPWQPDRTHLPQTASWLVDWSQVQPFLPLLIIAAVLVFALSVLWLYMASVYRFVLFDSVLYDRCELKGAWGRWERAGRRYFWWLIALFLSVAAYSLLLGGGAAFAMWRLGILRHPGNHVLLLVLGGFALVCILAALFVATALAAVFAKDFCVPLMAIEDLGMLDAWRRLLPMLAAEKMPFGGYILMKIVLAVGSAIIFGVISLLALFVVGIPLALAGAAIFFAGKAAGLAWGFPVIVAVAIVGAILLTGIFYLLALISTPPMVFFQAYAIYFFGSRYPALGVIVDPPPPAAPPDLSVVEPHNLLTTSQPEPAG